MQFIATSVAASSIVLIGDGFLLLGIVLALAARIPFYAEGRHHEWMTRWGLFISCIGACAVLIGTDDELHLGHDVWRIVAFAVLILSAAVILLLVLIARPWFRACVLFILKPARSLHRRIKKDAQQDEQQQADATNKNAHNNPKPIDEG